MDWVKFHCKGWLTGSVRDYSLEERAVWADLINLAGFVDEKYRDGGLWKSKDKPMDRKWICDFCLIPRNTFDKAIDTFIKDGCVNILDNGAIFLVNFARQQEVPNGKGKLTGRELEAWKIQTLNRLANEMPVEAMNADRVRPMIEKLVRGESDDEHTT